MAAPAPGGWGSTGLLRLFSAESGGQVAWLLPAALVLGGTALWFARRGPRLRPALALWLTWLVVTALTFSFMAGIFHAYYTVALAPAVGALVGTGAWVLWRHRASYVATGVLSVTTALTAVLAWALLGRAEAFLPWLRWLVLVLGLTAALALAGAAHLRGRLALAGAAAALVATLAGPAAYAVTTASQPHTGSIPAAGPATAGAPGGVTGGVTGGGPGGHFGRPPGGAPQGQPGTFTQGRTGNAAPKAGGMGGLLDGSTSPTRVTALLQQDAARYTWAAAAVGANNASGYQLAGEQPVMAIGGFNGSDPSPTLAQFEKYVAAGKIHWFIGGGGPGGGPGGGSTSSAAIAQWVEDNFTATTVDGVTLYDLSGGTR